jgi:hypothetical protein
VSHPKGPDHPGGAVPGTKGGKPEPDRQPRPAQLGMGNAREGTQSSSAPTSPSRLPGWVQKDTEEGSVNRRPGAAGLRSPDGVHPSILPAKSAALNPTTNGCRERSNPPPPLPEGSSRSGAWGGGRDGPRSERPRESRGIGRRGPRAGGGQRHPQAHPPERPGDGSVVRGRSLRPPRRGVQLPSLGRRAAGPGPGGAGPGRRQPPRCRDKVRPPGSWMSAKVSRPVLRTGTGGDPRA